MTRDALADALDTLKPMFLMLDDVLSELEITLVFEEPHEIGPALETLGDLKSLCRWMLFDAEMKINQGDWDTGMNRLNQVYRIADMAYNVKVHSSFLLGVSFENLANQAIKNWMNEFDLDTAMLSALHQQVSDRHRLAEIFVASSRGELAMLLSGDRSERFWLGLINLSRQQLLHRRLSEVVNEQLQKQLATKIPELTMRTSDPVDEHFMVRIGVLWYVINPEQVVGLRAAVAETLVALIDELPTGSMEDIRVLLGQLDYGKELNYAVMLRMILTFEHQRQLLRLGLQIKQYQAQHGDWPATLSELGDGVVIPNDPWTGEALRYERLGDGVVLYTVESEFHTNPLEQRDWRRLRLLGPSERGVKVDRDEVEG